MNWYREQPVKAVRKAHSCAGCGTRIEPGGSALYISGLSYGADCPFYGHYHADCRAAECGLNTIHACYADEDWLSLRDIEDEDHDWLRAKFPAVAARLNVAAVAA